MRSGPISFAQTAENMVRNAHDILIELVTYWYQKILGDFFYFFLFTKNMVEQFDNTIIDILTKSSHIKKKNKKSKID